MTETDSAAREIAAEQRYLDLVYLRLAELRRGAVESEKAGYRIARVGTFGALVERDAMVYHAARRRRTLDAEHDGLVFGRLDLHPDSGDITDLGPIGDIDEPVVAPPRTDGVDAAGGPPGAGDDNACQQDTTAPQGPDVTTAWAVAPPAGIGEVRYIGRLGLRDETLRARWSSTGGRRPPRPSTGPPRPSRWGWCGGAPSAAPARRVTGIEDDLLDPDGRTDRACRSSATARCSPSLSRATGTGMRDIVATIQREQDEAIRAPSLGVTIVRGRSGHRQDRGGPAPGRVPALLRPQPVRGRRRPGGRPVGRLRRVRGVGCCRRSARTPPPCARWAMLLDGHASATGTIRRRWRRSRARCGCVGC